MPQIDKGDAFKAFAKSGITVRVPKLTKQGERARDADGNCESIERPLAAEDIMAATDSGDELVIVTCDGRRLRTPKLAAK